MRGAIPLIPQYAFMAWSSVKKVQGQIYLYFTFNIILVKSHNLNAEDDIRLTTQNVVLRKMIVN
jgi:hypothetical protein